jgi:hypothetical protein
MLTPIRKPDFSVLIDPGQPFPGWPFCVPD